MQTYLRLPEVMQKTGLSRWTLGRMEKEGEFPKSIKMGKRAIAWSLAELDEWEQQRIAERDAAPKAA